MNAFAHTVLLILFFVTGMPADAQNPGKIRLIFAGDIMCHETQLLSAYDSITNYYDFSSYFLGISPLIQTADLAIANLETTLPGESFSGYPEFASPDELAQIALDAGFNCLVTGNNHSYDKGRKGLQRTIQVLNEKQILHTGTFVSEEEKDLLNPLIIKIHNRRIALLNYTYGINPDISIPDYLINIIDTVAIRKDLIKTKNLDPDFMICFLHWGPEYETQQSTEQQELANWLHKQGVQAVIGAHPHVVQPLEIIRSENNDIVGLTAFSLGNLISNQRSVNRKKGSILELVLDISGENIEIESVKQHPTLVKREPHGKQYKFEVTLPSWPAPTSQTADL